MTEMDAAELVAHLGRLFARRRAIASPHLSRQNAVLRMQRDRDTSREIQIVLDRIREYERVREPFRPAR